MTKIARYEKVINIPNSMTVLHDMLPVRPFIARSRFEDQVALDDLTLFGLLINSGILEHGQRGADRDIQFL